MGAVVVADRVLQQTMDQDDIWTGEVLPVGFVLDHVAAVATDELQAERADRRARVARTGRRPRHINEAVGEVEVAGLDQLNEPFTVTEGRLVRETEDRITFELHEPHRGSEPLADKR